MVRWCGACHTVVQPGDRECPHCWRPRPWLGWRRQPAAYRIADQLLADARDFFDEVERHGGFEPVDAPEMVRHHDEWVLLHASASTMAEVRRHRQGGWVGTRTRVGRMPLSFGQFWSDPVDSIDPVDTGDLYLTSERLAFLGSMRTITVPWASLVGVSGTLNTLRVSWTRSRTPVHWTVPNAILWALMARYLATAQPETPRLPPGSHLRLAATDRDGTRFVVLRGGASEVPVAVREVAPGRLSAGPGRR